MGRNVTFSVSRALIALLLAGTAFLGLMALADRSQAAWSETYQLNPASDQGAEQSSAAVDDAGNSAYVWVNTVDGGLMMNQVGAGGEPVPGSVATITVSGASAETPDISMNGDGTGMVVWSDPDTRSIIA